MRRDLSREVTSASYHIRGRDVADRTTACHSALRRRRAGLVGTGVGAAIGGSAAGAAAGSVAGPVGTVAGAVIGAVGGGLAGKAVAEQIDPTVEDAYWRESHASRPYYERDYAYDDYAPAYRSGWEARSKYPGRDWNSVENELGRTWDKTKGRSRLEWERANLAARDAWDRVERALPGDADNDGK